MPLYHGWLAGLPYDRSPLGYLYLVVIKGLIRWGPERRVSFSSLPLVPEREAALEFSIRSLALCCSLLGASLYRGRVRTTHHYQHLHHLQQQQQQHYDARSRTSGMSARFVVGVSIGRVRVPAADAHVARAVSLRRHQVQPRDGVRSQVLLQDRLQHALGVLLLVHCHQVRASCASSSQPYARALAQYSRVLACAYSRHRQSWRSLHTISGRSNSIAGIL